MPVSPLEASAPAGFDQVKYFGSSNDALMTHATSMARRQALYVHSVGNITWGFHSFWDDALIWAVGTNGSQAASEQGSMEVHPYLLGQDADKRWKFVLDAPPHLAKQIHAALSEQGEGAAPLHCSAVMPSGI